MPISPGNAKLGNIPNWSLRPVQDCTNCKACAKDCYALKAFKQYKNVRVAWTANAESARAGIFSDELDKYLFNKRPAFFRIHVSGDFFTREYAEQWARIACRHPDTKFLAFTKAFTQVKDVKFPGNVQIVNSAFPGMDDVPEDRPIAFAGEASDYAGSKYADRAKAALDCPGNCETCSMCWNLSAIGKDIRFSLN